MFFTQITTRVYNDFLALTYTSNIQIYLTTDCYHLQIREYKTQLVQNYGQGWVQTQCKNNTTADPIPTTTLSYNKLYIEFKKEMEVMQIVRLQAEQLRAKRQPSKKYTLRDS